MLLEFSDRENLWAAFRERYFEFSGFDHHVYGTIGISRCDFGTYTDSTFNIFSQIGIIVLIGIVTKNGILIVEFANQRREQGVSALESVTEAAVSRLRPILMTSLATILGALPIALALGAASLSRVSMGISIIGGLLFSLFLTLFVIPVLYTYMSRAKKIHADDAAY